MDHQTSSSSSSSLPRRRRRALFLTVACTLLDRTSAYLSNSPSDLTVTPFVLDQHQHDKGRRRPLPTSQERTLRTELHSKLPFVHRPASSPTSTSTNNPRGNDSQLSAATLAYTDPTQWRTNDSEEKDPFDPSTFLPQPTKDGLDMKWWGTAPALEEQRRTLAKDDNFQIFCDLDGVLVDFEAGVQRICRLSTRELTKKTMWQRIAESNTAFFQELPWMSGGRKLWKAIRPLKPDILTGVPDLPESRWEKFQWCRENLGMSHLRHVDMAGEGYLHNNCNDTPKACKVKETHVTNIITCWSYNKHHESGKQAILIDDRICLKESWEAKGGIFVHHTDAESTLEQLKAIGVPIDEEHDDDVDASQSLRP